MNTANALNISFSGQMSINGAGIVNAASKAKSDNVDFTNIFKNVKSAGSDTGIEAKNPENRIEGKEADDFSKLNNASDKTAINEKNESLPKEFKDELKACAEEIKEMIKEYADVSDEDVEKILEALGFTLADLLNPSNAALTLANAMGVEDTGFFMTDTNFGAYLKDIVAALDGQKEMLSKEFGLSSEDFSKLLDDFQDSYLSEQTIDQTVSLQDELPKENDILDFAIADDTKVKTQAKTVEETDTMREENFIKDEENVKTSDTENKASTADDELMNNEQKEANQVSKKDEAPLIKDEHSLNVFNNFTERLTQALEETNETMQARQIVEQIMDEIKTTIKADTSKIEMQLYPENLGKLGIEVASKDSILTAKITVSNHEVEQIVKANLEVLKESLNNQGLKVENLEVAVASRSFDDNFQGTKEENQGQSKGRKSFRIIGEEEGIGDTLEESTEELLLKGATVSYSA